MYAVIQTGGKQYRVKEGDLVSVEKLEAGDGQKVDFKRVLLIEDGQTILVGTPVLEKAVVRAEVVETYKDYKVLVFKKKRTKQFRRTRGHRQQLTKVRVEGIYADASAAPPVETAARKPAPVREKAPEVKAKAAAPAPEKKAAPAVKKPAAKPKRAGKEARAKAGPKAKTPVRKTASAKPAAKPRKKTKE
jgi:large subunit ribosomal protein L21